ncbi:hypothetical protein B1790_19840 [Mycobacterium sp. AT1]|nr:hypothetical protein B1790_19840 [Mycobacterium sp. AT1]
MPDNWSRDPAVLDTTVRGLVPRLHTVSSVAIPYARLPRRLRTHAERFPRWGDVASETPQSLLNLPKVGEAAVAALVDGAAEAVRVAHHIRSTGPMGIGPAVAFMLGRLDDYDRVLLARRVCALLPAPQHEVAAELGVDAASVGRNAPRAEARVRELLADPAHCEVLEYVEALRGRLGHLTTHVACNVELSAAGVEPGGTVAELLLYLAGPYTLRSSWIEVHTPDGRPGHDTIRAALDGLLEEHPAPTTHQLLDNLSAQGMTAGLAITYLREWTSLRCVGDVWVRWAEAGVGNRAEAALQVLGVPATSDTIDRILRSVGVTDISSLSRVMSVDKRFARASRHTWALRVWGLPEYTGVSDAIAQRIDAAGGRAKTVEVIRDVLAAIPDITESSVRSYMSTLAFVIEDGVVRRRTKADPWPPVQPLYTFRSGYRNGRNDVRVVFPADHDLLRGSGQAVPSSVAHAVGVTPGQRTTFTNTAGELTLYWDLTSTSGALIGSLRAQAAAVEAAFGDDVILVLRPSDASFEVIKAPKDEAPRARLQKLLGRRPKNPLTAMAASLECPPHLVVPTLQRRGEQRLLQLIGEPPG